ncbi:hypothetical protein L218DRAFT_1007935 [Marasmius fiardii PR-910]|nr:hypothetical protein L218DRAFT_1007935 [Marasmius fiardii PR-910]
MASSVHIPWKDLAQFISLGTIQGEDGLRFLERASADPVEKRNTILRIVNAIARSVESRLEEKSKLLPRPEASQEELQSAGVILGEALFPDDIVKHAKTMRNPPCVPINQIDSWNFTFVHSAHIAAILHAISAPNDPFAHLPILTHLAQRPRTRFLALQLAASRTAGQIRQKSVIEEYVRLTCRQYLFLNVLLALDENGDSLKNDGARKMECFPHTSDALCIEGYLPRISIHSDSECGCFNFTSKWFPSSGDRLHTAFWRLTHEDTVRRECMPTLREEYIQRCLDVTAVWYAISNEASKVYNAVQLQQSLHAFDISNLFAIILDSFRSLGDALLISGDPLDDLLSEYQHVAVHKEVVAQDLVSVLPTPTSPHTAIKGFLDLPVELHFEIAGYLPVHDLISLSMVCRSLHHQCTVLILRDPLSFLGELSTDSFDAKIYRRFQSMLEAKPHLLHHVRRYTGYYNHLPFDATKGSGRHSKIRFARGVDVTSPLASRLSRLCWAELDLWNMDYWDQDPDRGIYHALQVAQKCWPNVQHLELKIYQEPTSIAPIYDHTSHEPAGTCSMSCSCEAPTWRLRQLSITTHVYRDMLGIQHTPYPPVPLSSLLESCAGTLTRLKLNLPTVVFRDIPRLPHLSHLVLPSSLPPPDVAMLLSRCPSLSSLKFGPWEWSETIPGTPLDLSDCPNLAFLQLERTPYKISHLPESIRCVHVEMHRLLPLILEVHNPLQASVSALRITLELNTRSRTVEALHEVLIPLSKEYPKLSFLELQTQGFYYGMDDQLVELVKCASTQFPSLETFIINWRDFNNNPRRIDFPAVDSGQEERERGIARRIFVECESLAVVALTGVPPVVHDNPHVHPRMVWAKAVDDEGNVGVVKAGRSAIRNIMEFDESL